jgi:hypothetical protein
MSMNEGSVSCYIIRPYCFSLSDRSGINERDPEKSLWCDSCIHFIDCQEAYPNRPKILTLNLKEKYFNMVKIGIKLVELRQAKEYWIKRFENHHYDVVEICNGYPRNGDLKNRIFFKYSSIYRDYYEWENGKQKMKCDTFFIPLIHRIDYPYQVIEQTSQDKPVCIKDCLRCSQNPENHCADDEIEEQRRDIPAISQ